MLRELFLIFVRVVNIATVKIGVSPFNAKSSRNYQLATEKTDQMSRTFYPVVSRFVGINLA